MLFPSFADKHDGNEKSRQGSVHTSTAILQMITEVSATAQQELRANLYNSRHKTIRLFHQFLNPATAVQLAINPNTKSKRTDYKMRMDIEMIMFALSTTTSTNTYYQYHLQHKNQRVILIYHSSATKSIPSIQSFLQSVELH